jgi:hypothetical protein
MAASLGVRQLEQELRVHSISEYALEVHSSFNIKQEFQINVVHTSSCRISQLY